MRIIGGAMVIAGPIPITGLAQAHHRRRRARIAGEPDRGCALRARTTSASAVDISDTRFVIALLSSIHAMLVARDTLLRSVGVEGGELGTERFLNWVANLLDAHLNATGP